ncbi:6261_t:CDS:2, partial [Gigaspora margarita]
MDTSINYESELAFANASHDMIKIGDIDRYEKAVKKYLQVGQYHRTLENTLHARRILRAAKLQREDTAAIETSTSPLEFSPDNPYINRDKSEKPVNKLFSTDMNISNDYEPEPPFTNTPHSKIKIRDTDGYKELVKKYLQVEQSHKVYGNTLH